MGFFDNPNEAERRLKLKTMEDSRMRFAEKMRREGFAPDRMTLLSTEQGGLVGLCREGGDVCLIQSPGFGEAGEYKIDRQAQLKLRCEEHYEAAEGIGGAFGFGKKETYGFRLIITLENEELSVPVVANQNSGRTYRAARNPILSTRRRKRDTNPVWDLEPISKANLPKLRRALEDILGPLNPEKPQKQPQ